MFSDSYAYQAEVPYRRQQLDADLARREQAKQAKQARLVRRNRKPELPAPAYGGWLRRRLLRLSSQL